MVASALTTPIIRRRGYEPPDVDTIIIPATHPSFWDEVRNSQLYDIADIIIDDNIRTRTSDGALDAATYAAQYLSGYTTTDAEYTAEAWRNLYMQELKPINNEEDK